MGGRQPQFLQKVWWGPDYVFRAASSSSLLDQGSSGVNCNCRAGQYHMQAHIRKGKGEGGGSLWLIAGEQG